MVKSNLPKDCVVSSGAQAIAYIREVQPFSYNWSNSSNVKVGGKESRKQGGKGI